ncbi:MAG: type II toxin-antitoxin system PemK/MazF family toxin [Clostridiaceae bacterium]|nr:type II toxin-antitoxin system PemK/MazF family toxin [Clostridiaceae bacterium]
MEVKRGEVYLASFPNPHTKEGEDLRPVLIIQNDCVSQSLSTVTVLPITKGIIPSFSTFIQIYLQPLGECKVLINNMTTIPKERLIRKLDVVCEKDMERITYAVLKDLANMPAR